MRKVDAHCHFDPERITPDEVDFIADAGVDYSEEGLLRETKLSHIEHSILISTRYRQNDRVKNLALKYPNKFSAVATLMGEKNLSKAQKALAPDFKKKSYVGLKFYLGYESIVVTDKKWHPFYALALKYDFPIIFHTGDSLGAAARLRYSHPLQIDELAVRLPKLKIVLAHFGNPWVMDAAEIVYKNPNVYADLSGFFVGGQGFDKYLINRVNQAVAFCGTEKLMFGTDYPEVRLKDYCEFFDSLDLNEKQRTQIYNEIAKKLFGIP